MCVRHLAAMDSDVGLYRMHCPAEEATLVREDTGVVLGALALAKPLLVLTDSALVVLTTFSSSAAAVLHLQGAAVFI